MSKDVKKTTFNKINTKVNNFENKIADVSTLIQAYSYNADKVDLEKLISDVENKIPDTCGLVTTAIFNTKKGKVENKILDFSGSVKKTKNNAKVSDIEKKCFTTSDYNKRRSEILYTNLKQRFDQVSKFIYLTELFHCIYRNLRVWIS